MRLLDSPGLRSVVRVPPTIRVDELVSATFPIEGVQDALTAMHDGKVNRAVLDLQ